MNWLDAVIFLILIIPTFIGFKRGLAKTALPLLGIVSGVVLAGVFHSHMADLLSSWLKSPNQAKVAAFLIIFVLFIIVGLLLFWLLRKSLPTTGRDSSRFGPGRALLWLYSGFVIFLARKPQPGHNNCLPHNLYRGCGCIN